MKCINAKCRNYNQDVIKPSYIAHNPVCPVCYMPLSFSAPSDLGTASNTPLPSSPTTESAAQPFVPPQIDPARISLPPSPVAPPPVAPFPSSSSAISPVPGASSLPPSPFDPPRSPFDDTIQRNSAVVPASRLTLQPVNVPLSVNEILRKYYEVMQEKNTGVFHPTEAMHQLWWNFEYFHTRFAKKAAAEISSTALSVATATALGAAGGLQSGAIALGGSVAGKTVTLTGSNIIKKVRRQFGMNKGQKTFTKDDPVANQNINLLYEMYAWPGYAARVPVQASGDIYYKPPKSGSINSNLLNYNFFLEYIKNNDQPAIASMMGGTPGTQPTLTQDMLKQMTFKKLDAFWQMSNDWPMLDYLFFNYGFFYYSERFFIDKLESSLKIIHGEQKLLPDLLYASRFYFLSKNFYLEHFFRIILPTYEFVLRAHRRDALINMPDNFLFRVLGIIQSKQNTQSVPTSVLHKFKSTIAESSSVSFVKKTHMPIGLAPFLALIKEYANQMQQMNYSVQVSHFNLLIAKFIDLSTGQNVVDLAPRSPIENNVFNRLSAVFVSDDDPIQIVNPDFRQLIQSQRTSFFEDPQFVFELQKLKAFFYTKLKRLVATGNVNEAWIDAGRIEIIANLFDTWFSEYSVSMSPTEEPIISDFAIGTINGLATSLAIFALTGITEMKIFKKLSGDRASIKFIAKNIKHLFRIFGAARIGLGTMNYIHEVFVRDSTKIFDFLNSNVMSSGLMSAGLIGPNIASLVASFAIESFRMKIYDDMDKECLRIVDRLVQIDSRSERSLIPQNLNISSFPSSSSSSSSSFSGALSNPSFSQQPPVSPQSPKSVPKLVRDIKGAKQSALSISPPVPDDTQKPNELFCKIYMLNCIYENMQHAEDSQNNSSTHEYRTQGGILISISPVKAEIEKLKNYIRTAESLGMDVHRASLQAAGGISSAEVNILKQDAHVLQISEEIYLQFCEMLIKLISIKKHIEKIDIKPPESNHYQSNIQYISKLSQVMQECDDFYDDFESVLALIDERLLRNGSTHSPHYTRTIEEHKTKTANEIKILNNEVKKIVNTMGRNLNAFMIRRGLVEAPENFNNNDFFKFEENPQFATDGDQRNFWGRLIEGYRKISKDYHENIRWILRHTDEQDGTMRFRESVTQSGHGAALGAEQSIYDAQTYSALQREEFDYARKLNLGFVLAKPFKYLTEAERLTLYRDFGRVVRHLFQHTPQPSDLMGHADKLNELVNKIAAETDPTNMSLIKEFVKKQFSYTQDVLFKENFVYYSRVYQFLCERLRMEFLSESKDVLTRMEADLNSFNATSGLQATENIQALFGQLQNEYVSFFPPVQGGSFQGVKCPTCHSPEADIPSGWSASSTSHYCPRCKKLFTI